MDQFINRHEKDIHGVLSGLDRIRFRGTVRWFGSVRGVMTFLWELQVRLTQFTAWAKGLTQQIVEASEQIAAVAGRPPCRSGRAPQTVTGALIRSAGIIATLREKAHHGLALQVFITTKDHL